MTAEEAGQTQESNATERIIDVGEIQPQHRHAIIFRLFDHLRPENSLQLVVDHDPRRLRFQLEANFGSKCSWTYIEQGPDVWRVRLRHQRD